MPTDLRTSMPRDDKGPKDHTAPGMDTTDDQEVKTRCMEALLAAGVSPKLCQFYGDAQQCECTMFHTVYRMHKELRDASVKPTADVSCLMTTVDKIQKTFDGWQQTIEQLASQSHSLPPLTIDPTKFDENVVAQAKCWLKTKSVKMSAGDEITITDITHPNKLKIRTGEGVEGYVPTLSCFLPSPDWDAASTVKRMQVHLLMCWVYCDDNVKTASHHVIALLTTLLRDESEVYFRSHGRDSGHAGAINAIVANVDKELDGAEQWTAFCLKVDSLLQEFRSLKTFDLTPMLENLTDIERVIILYDEFHEHVCRCKHYLEENSVQPISIEICHDLHRLRSRARRHKYYEVKMTTEETTTEEETTFVKVKVAGDGDQADVRGGQSSQSVDHEQLTSMSHEESSRFVIKSVIDPRTAAEISMDQAVRDGIVDPQRGLYIDPTTQQTSPIAEAMSDGRIVVERVSTTKSAAKTQSIGIITVRTQTDTREYSIGAAVDTTTGQTVTADEARRRGIVDEATGMFIDLKTGEKLPLSDAIDAGLVTAEYDNGQESTSNGGTETKTYAVNAVVDQLARKAVPFPEAVSRGLMDRETGSFINNATGERVFAAEAIRRGLFKAVLVTDPSSLSNIDASNRVVVERIDRVRKNVLRNMKTIAAFRRQSSSKQ